MFTRSLWIGSLLALTFPAGAQTIQVVGNPVPPGVAFTVILTNNSGGFLPVSAAPSLHMLRASGELIAPEIVGCGPVGIAIPPNAVQNLSFIAPASGPGSSGSFVLLFPYGAGAVARVDVGAASSGFPDIHAYPVGTPFNATGHRVLFPPGQTPDWEFSNTGASNHTFAGGSLDLFSPGGTVAVASLGLTGITVPAGGSTRVLLPLSSLAPGPYRVRAQWVDPATSSLTTVQHGIEAATTTGVDLHLPGGRVVPLGGSIPVRLAMRGFATTGGFPPTSEPLTYALLLGHLPGSTPLPGGAVLPLALDALVGASLVNGVGGILTNHIGPAADMSTYCAHGLLVVPAATSIQIKHLNVAVLSGLTFRAAGLAVNLQGTFAASQPEDITFQ